jgi:hypothetical protein
MTKYSFILNDTDLATIKDFFSLTFSRAFYFSNSSITNSCYWLKKFNRSKHFEHVSFFLFFFLHNPFDRQHIFLFVLKENKNYFKI